MHTAPSSDEIEVSFLGPGYGECVLIHAMNNEWIIVDSCVDPLSKYPLAIDYLRKISVKPEDAVKLVVASHWHDDHIRGLSQVYDVCKSAEFVMSDALTGREFLVLTESIGIDAKIEGSSGIEEFHKIFKIIEESSKKTSSRQFKVPLTASENQCLWVSSDNKTRVTSLSPTSYSKLQSLRDIANLLPKINEPKKWIVPSLINANYVSVVLWVEVDNITILLGADLEESGNPHQGWSAIVNSNKRPLGKASIYKIPHHGSETGESLGVWNGMLTENPIAVCSPYNRGKFLPTQTDIRRILSRTDQAYITAAAKTHASKLINDSSVKKTIKEAGIKFVSTIFKPGIVRYRIKSNNNNGDHKVELFNGATHLNKFPTL